MARPENSPIACLRRVCCAFCGGFPYKIRDSKNVGHDSRMVIYDCLNPDCGRRYRILYDCCAPITFRFPGDP